VKSAMMTFSWEFACLSGWWMLFPETVSGADFPLLRAARQAGFIAASDLPGGAVGHFVSGQPTAEVC
jgi:hypothetical protein